MKDCGLYIHIPFCRSKCLYCDFYTGGLRIADWDAYVKSVLNELELRKTELPCIPTTLYIGGGTPSLLPVKNFRQLVDGIKQILRTDLDFKEFTLEANPEDISKENCYAWLEMGVNRLSIGIQTLDDKELKTIGRSHDSAVTLNALNTARSFFSNISADIMFGLPGQTFESYLSSLEKICSLRLPHLSSYSLMLEPGTAMSLLVREKRISVPSEEEWIRMYELTNSFLGEQGYFRYEISNYSKPAFESIHNTSYWKGIPYLGLGPGAHSYDGNKIRKENPNDIKSYIKKFSGSMSEINRVPFYKEEILNDEEIEEEFIMMRLRMASGIDLSEFEKTFGKNNLDKLLKKSERFISNGGLYLTDNHLYLSDKGFSLYNDIISSIM